MFGCFTYLKHNSLFMHSQHYSPTITHPHPNARNGAVPTGHCRSQKRATARLALLGGGRELIRSGWWASSPGGRQAGSREKLKGRDPEH